MKKAPFLALFFLLNFLSQAQCDTTRNPIVFIHGFLASGDSYAAQLQRFEENGYCADRLFLFDWNTLGGPGKKGDSLLNNFIDGVLKRTGAKQVDLVGHSAGGVLGRGYLVDPQRAGKVAHYINIGSRRWYADYEWFPNNKCLNIYSAGDMVMGAMGGKIENAQNLDLVNQDHYQVVTSEESFRAMMQFLTGKDSAEINLKPAPEKQPIISGKALLLGTNEPMKNAEVAVFKINPRNGKRKSKEPELVMRVSPHGEWGTFLADPTAYYEFELQPADSADRVISYFFEPFTQSDAAVYLRGFPRGNMVAAMLGKIPAKKDESAVVIYSARQAVIQGRDSLAINRTALSSATLTPASRTIISTFVFEDGDGISSGKAMEQFGKAPFLGGVDLLLPASPNGRHTVYFNGRKLVLPARASKDCILLAVFR